MILFRLNPEIKQEFAYINSTDLDSESRDMLIQCQPIENLKLRNVLVKNYTKIFPDFMGTGSVEIFVNDKLKEILTHHLKLEDVKFHEIKFHDRTYYLVNLLNLKECMDYKNSIYTTYSSSNALRKITSLEVLDSELSEIELFRMKEKPTHLFATEQLVSILRKNNVSGIDYNSSKDLTVG